MKKETGNSKAAPGKTGARSSANAVKKSSASSNGRSSSGNGSKASGSNGRAASANGNSKAASANGRSASGNGSTKAAGSNGRTAPGNGQNKSRTQTSSNGQAVKAKSGAAKGLNTLFEDMLADIYWAEKALTKALPKMMKNASSPELKEALQEHLAVTQEQVSRVEEVFAVIGKPAKAKKCAAMEGLIKEGEEIMQETEQGVVRDAGIIAAGQKIEHYEIASYGTLSAFARTLGETEAADLLDQTLEEEKEADDNLTQVAMTAVNVDAAAEDDEAEEEDDVEEEDEEEDEEEEDE